MKPSALLIGVVAVAAAAGVAISTAQRPPAPKPPPTPTPSAVPTPIPAGPVSGSGFSVADDPSSGQVVLFGGVDNYANTWLWAGGRWTLANPSLSPPGRIDAAEAYDPSTQQVLLFGGRHNPLGSGPLLNDTWAWNGASWIEVDNGAAGPTPGEGASMAWDPALREMVLVTSAGNASGGDATWVWFGAHWQNQPHGAVAPNAFDLPMAYDPVTRSLIAEGCCSTPVSPLGALDTTWQWNGSRWLQLAGTAEPLPGSYMALDPAGNRLALCNCGPGLSLPVLASWTGHAWAVMTVDKLPIQPVAEISDPTLGELLIVGSDAPVSQYVAQPVHLWALRGKVWTQIDTGPAIS
jgi:hypothetical protein